MSKIGKWIAEVYYSFLWFTGAKDEDNDESTTEDRDKFTWWLRRSKVRMGLIWWPTALLVLYASTFWLVYRLTHLSWAVVPAAILWLFLNWLFAHVLETPYVPDLRASRRSFVAGRIARRFDVA